MQGMALSWPYLEALVDGSVGQWRFRGLRLGDSQEKTFGHLRMGGDTEDFALNLYEIHRSLFNLNLQGLASMAVIHHQLLSWIRSLLTMMITWTTPSTKMIWSTCLLCKIIALFGEFIIFIFDYRCRSIKLGY